MNTKMFRILLTLHCFVFAGCGLDEEYTGLGERWNADRHPDECICNCNSDDQDEGDLEVDSVEGRLYRVTSLALTAPIGGIIGEQLNKYFADEIGNENLNILLKVALHAGEEIRFAVGNGTSQSDGYQLGDETSMLVCTINGATFRTTSPAQLTFPVAEGLLDPPLLPIKELQLAGKFDPQGLSIGKGGLVGALTLEDAQAIQVFGTDMASFLEGLDILPDLDLDEDQTADAYKFVGQFEAARVIESVGG